MNGYQIKQRDRVLDPNNIPVRALTDWEKGFRIGMRRWKDEKELSDLENKKLNEVAKLYAEAGS